MALKRARSVLYFLLIILMFICISSFFLQYLRKEKIFFRYQINNFYELKDYFNDINIENYVFQYTIQNGFLYTYGLTGYTKANLGLHINVVKVVNAKYDKNLKSTVEGRGSFYSTIYGLGKTYSDKLVILNNFYFIENRDVEVFMRLYRKEIEEKNTYEHIKGNSLYYRDGADIMCGLEEVNKLLTEEYQRRLDHQR